MMACLLVGDGDACGRVRKAVGIECGLTLYIAGGCILARGVCA